MNNLLTPEAKERGWIRYAMEHHLDLVVLVEAVGLALAERTYNFPPEILERARQIQNERNYHVKP